MRTMSRTLSVALSATLILSLLLVVPGAASERESYAERSRQWVDVEELHQIIQEQMEIAGPWMELNMEPLLEEEMAELMEGLGPMLEEIQVEVQESLRENMIDVSEIQIEVQESLREEMVDVAEILRESLEGIRIDSPRRVRVQHYESRQERIEDEIRDLERRLERLREQLKDMDDKF